jgi:hypothetical protein
MRNKRLLLALAATLVALLALPLVVSANHSWSTYHWGSTGAVGLSLGDNVSSTWTDSLTLASSDWNMSTEINTVVEPGDANPKNCKVSTGLAEICSNTYGNNGWLGIAGISISGGHIVKGYVKVNDTYFNTTKYNTVPWRNLVMCQEVGHLFGLGHQDEDFNNGNLDTCMDYTSDPESNQHPNAHDYEQLQTIYGGHGDANTWIDRPISDGGGGGGGGNNGGGRGRPSDTPGANARGQAVASDAQGRANVFVLDLKGGDKQITHVFWAN